MSDACGMMCDGFLQYSVNKRLRVSIWQVAFFHRFLQVIIGAYILIELYVNDHWAFAEQPNAAYNMYVSAGKSNDVINAAADLDATFKYCNNASYSYAYSPEYRYGDPPQCRQLSTGEATVKMTDSFFFTTMFDERHEFGWTCNGADEASQYGACVAVATDMGGEAVNASRGLQCTCRVRQAYYPVGVEHMKMAMEISYLTSNFFGNFNGSTSVPYHELTPMGRALEVRLYNSTGHNLLKDRYTPPLTDWIAFSLKDLLGACDLDLDSPNPSLTADYRTQGEGQTKRYPPFRTSGVNMQMLIDFRNSDPLPNQERIGGTETNLYAMLQPHDVRAEITLQPDTKQWAGLGPIMAYERFPSGPGGRSFHKIERYRQGVVVRFVTVGHVLKFDFRELMLQLVVAFGMLAAAKLLTETIGVFLCVDRGTRRMLQGKARETVTETSEFAELGLKAALAARQFHLFDASGKKRIDLFDVATAFAHVEQITPMEAYKMATVVLCDADTDYVLQHSSATKIANSVRRRLGFAPIERHGDVTNAGIDFLEFVTCLEGDSTGFKNYVRDLRAPRKVDHALLKRIETYFEDHRSSVAHPRKLLPDDTPHTALGMSGVHAGPPSAGLKPSRRVIPSDYTAAAAPVPAPGRTPYPVRMPEGATVAHRQPPACVAAGRGMSEVHVQMPAEPKLGLRPWAVTPQPGVFS